MPLPCTGPEAKDPTRPIIVAFAPTCHDLDVAVVRIIAGVLGAIVAVATLGSAVRMVVVPRGEQTFIGRATFIGVRFLFDLAADLRRDWPAQEAIKARFAPVALVLLPLIWAVGVIGGTSGIFWALGVEPYSEALVLSGSSLTTLGFRTTSDLPTLLIAIFEGLVGLGIVALLISFLPTIYAAFSRRESEVAKLHLRSTDEHGQASAATMLIRHHQIDDLTGVAELWADWENWFVEIEETHTSFPMLAFFRSPVANRSWITGAGLALDAASLYCSTLDLPRAPRAQLMIRTGTLSLRRVCDFFGFDYDPDPQPQDPISVERQEWDDVYDALAEAGLPVVVDRDQAWADYAGWRVNYDRPLLSIAAFVEAPPALWSSDRSIAYRRPTMLRRSQKQ